MIQPLKENGLWIENRIRLDINDDLSRENAEYVYFIAALGTGLVKIGRCPTQVPIVRLKQLQCGCPVPLQLLAFVVPAVPLLEKALHRHFARYKHHGEWFWINDELRDFIMCSCRVPHTSKMLMLTASMSKQPQEYQKAYMESLRAQTCS